MFYKFVFVIIGFLLMTIGFCYIIIYSNLLTFGYTLGEYFDYLIKRYECWYFVFGLLIEIIIVFRRENRNVKCL